MALSFIVTGTAWKWILNPTLGIEKFARDIGFETFTFDWLTTPGMSIYTIVIAGVWQSSGFIMAIFLAGLRSVDDEIIKAAKIDGANLVSIYTKIILPMMRPVFMSAVVILVHLAIKSYDLVINMGAAGCFHNAFKKGDVVEVVEDYFSELGFEDGEFFSDFPDLKVKYINKARTSFRKVTGITVNTVHGNRDSIKAITQRLDVDIESMEGASVFKVCQQFNVPCIQIRSISNIVEERNREKWDAETIGSKIKIISEEKSKSMNPDFYLVLPWHFKEEFLIREKKFLNSGGKMIFPLPKIKIY